VIFCARSELTALYQSDFVVCDGTFEMAPDSAYQLYTLHSFIHGEALALFWALLPNKSQATYQEIFGAIRDCFVATFGDVGRSRVFLADFELAAINALKNAFPQSTVKGCTFHFHQAVMRRVQTVSIS